MRLTKIVTTLGPSSTKPEVLKALIENGINVARINFSHGTQEGHRKTIHLVKEMSASLNKPVALLLDTKGPEIRSGDVETPIAVKKGEEVIFSSVDLPNETMPVIKVNYGEFSKDVSKAECIIVDNGTMFFDIVNVRNDGAVIAKSRDDGNISSRRHINLPGADVSLPAMTDKDWSDLELGIEEKMDFVALSFIRTAEEVAEVVKYLKKRESGMKVITKVETRQSVADIDRIIDVSDGIMIARGDLGAEMPFERIPAVQDMIVSKCRAKGKPVIVATQMLESMIKNPMPTRAEVTDVAHAATTRADATMLSGETAAGDHPLLSVQAMIRILCETESHLAPQVAAEHSAAAGDRGALADAAVSMATTLKSPAIAVLTRSGMTACAVSGLRPGVPVIALTDSPEVQRNLQLYHAIVPLLISFDDDRETTVERAFEAMKEHKLVQVGQQIVVITDVKTKDGFAHTVHVRVIS